MEERNRSVNTRELLDAYRTLLPQVDSLPLRISGSSMAPFLVHQRDTVHLCQLRRPPKVGDIVLYQRDSGAYVLHRVCKVRGTLCDLIGDAQQTVETGVRRDQIFARVLWAERKGKRQAPGRFWWTFFEKIWVRMIPLRPLALRGYRTVQILLRRIAP